MQLRKNGIKNIYLTSRQPISVFGLAHLLERNKITEACVVEHPRIQEEITLPKHESALAALLRDHLLDLDLFIEDPKGKVELEREEGGRSETRI